MNKRASKIEIIKIPSERPTSRPKRFPSMSRMYLELIENKNKIKQELVNKEHEPEKIRDEVKKTPENDEDNVSDRSRSAASHVSNRSRSAASHVSETRSVDSYSSLSSSDKSNNRHISPNESDVLSSPDSKSVSTKRSKSPSKSAELRKRIKQLLGDEKKDNIHKKSPKVNHSNRPEPPPLSRLQEQGIVRTTKVIPDLDRIKNTEQEEDDLKRELLFKFELLKKSYKGIQVPEFSVHTDYMTLQKTYETTLRKVSLDNAVDTYKTYLIGGFMLVEFVLGNWFNFDMQGFTQQQMVSMNSYERLLVELGEKSYVPTGSKWPVEIRLLSLIIINAAFFIITRMIMKKTGANLLGMMNNMPSSNNTAATQIQKPKTRMKGPDINLDDLPEVKNDVQTNNLENESEE
jgi:hypothetical protein